MIATAPSSRHILKSFKQARTHRIPFHNVLLSNVPKDTIRYDHKVLDHQIVGDQVRLLFDHEKSETFDLLVAADGLYSARLYFSNDTCSEANR